MHIRGGVIAFVWLVALQGGCAKGSAPGEGDGDDTGDDGSGDDVAVPDAGGGDEPDAGGHVDPPDAGGGGGEPVTITHSTTMTLEAETGVACQSGFGNAKNSWYRVFDLPAMGITGSLDVSQMTVGVQEASSGNGNGQSLTVKLHQLTGAFIVANLSELGNAKITVPDTSLQTFQIPITASVPAGITLVAEMTVPNGEARGNFLFPGANNDGQTGPTWVKSECGGPQPVDAASIDFPDFHLVLSIDAIEH